MKFLINPNASCHLRWACLLAKEKWIQRNKFSWWIKRQSFIQVPNDDTLTLDHKSKVKDFEIAIYNQKINNKEIENSYFKRSLYQC